MSHNFFFKYQQCRLNWVPTMCWASCFHCSLDKYVLRTYHVQGRLCCDAKGWVCEVWMLGLQGMTFALNTLQSITHFVSPASLHGRQDTPVPTCAFPQPLWNWKKAQILTLHCILEHVLSAGGGLSYLHFILHKVDTAVAGSSPPRLPVQNVVKISGLEMYSLRLQRLMGGLSF